MRSLVFLALCALLALVVGCGGQASHDIDTGEDGSLDGLEIRPTPQDLHVGLSDDFYLDWYGRDRPPRTFRVALVEVEADGDTVPVYTDLVRLSAGHYRLSPVASLDDETFLLLEVTSAGEAPVRAMYLTDAYRGAATKTPTGPGQATHTVTE